PQVVLLYLAFVFGRIAVIGCIRPGVRVVRIGVREDPGERRRAVEAGGEPEPRLVLLDRAADRLVQIPGAVDLGRGRQAGVLKRRRVVVALHRLVRERVERRVAERVAAVLRDEVDADAAGGHLGRERRRVDGDFGGGAHVGLLSADVAPGLQRHDAEAVEHHALVDRLAAVYREALADVRDAGASDVRAAA